MLILSCYTINCCDNDYNLLLYHTEINCEQFIDGYIYNLKNNPQICDDCEQEDCICNKITCYRCGRLGHYSSACYTKRHCMGYNINAR